MNEFPRNLNDALSDLAKGRKLCLGKDTHFEANNRELEWIKGNVCHRLNFNHAGIDITVCYYKDIFKVFPRFFRWCHNFIPLFPCFVKIQRKPLENLPSNMSKADYLAESS